MKAVYRLALALSLAVVALVLPAAHAQTVTANIEGAWQAGNYLATVTETGYNNDGSLNYVAQITNLDGSSIMYEGYPVSIPIQGTLRGNPTVGYWFDFVFQVQVAGVKAGDGTGRLTLSQSQNVLDGSWAVTGMRRRGSPSTAGKASWARENAESSPRQPAPRPSCRGAGQPLSRSRRPGERPGGRSSPPRSPWPAALPASQCPFCANPPLSAQNHWRPTKRKPSPVCWQMELDLGNVRRDRRDRRGPGSSRRQDRRNGSPTVGRHLKERSRLARGGVRRTAGSDGRASGSQQRHEGRLPALHLPSHLRRHLDRVLRAQGAVLIHGEPGAEMPLQPIQKVAIGKRLGNLGKGTA